jgi:AraC family transcriptional regulator
MRSSGKTAAATIEGVQHELLRTFPLKSTSSGRVWQGVHVNEFAEVQIEELNSGPRDHVKIGLCLGTSPYILREACGKTMVGPSQVGEFSLLPQGRKSRWRGLVPAHLDIRLDATCMAEMVTELRRFGERRFDFADVQRMRDPVVESFGAIFRQELDNAPHPAQDLMIDSLALALCAHLLRNYTNAVDIEERSTVSVDVAAIRRAIAYIEENPARTISLQELAIAAGLSRFHFSRIFKHKLGISPARYVERTRIERAKRLIINADMSLANVALAVGFADQSHFSRRFRFHEGRTPAGFAREHARGILPSK